MYRVYNARPIPDSRKTGRRFKAVYILFIFPILLIAYCAFALLRPLPTPETVFTPPVTTALIKVNIPWPKSGPREQAAFGADEYGFLASSNTIETAAPTASIAKVVTALAVLQKKPLKPDEPGPDIPLTAADTALYKKYAALDGSVIPVASGSSMTELEALQAILLPSANNIADSLAIWAFGSMDAYTAYANSMVKKFGMNATNITDASGFAKTTVSTAPDLIKLGDNALDNPVLAEIINTQSAQFPGYGTIRNTNTSLGQHGIRGIKTGSTDEAGGVFLGAADVQIGSGTVRVITAVIGAPDLATAFRDTIPLIQSAPSQFQTVHVVKHGQNIGKATTAWGTSAPIIAGNPIDVVSWTGTSVPAPTANFAVTAPAASGTDIGNITVNFKGESKKASAKLAADLAGPSPWWRLTHPL